jgi:hypothetical protein
MTRPRPKRIVIEFEDGARSEASYRDLPSVLWAEILRQPFASRQRPADEPGHFVLMEWTDGWREVSSVDPSCTGLHRYHVITRPEDVGRLSLAKPDGYPELLEISRRPLEVARITTTESFALGEAKLIREGKKTERHFALVRDGERLAELRAELRVALREEGTDPNDVLSADPSIFRPACESLQRRMGLRPAYRQQDVVDFIRHLVWTLGQGAAGEQPR